MTERTHNSTLSSLVIIVGAIAAVGGVLIVAATVGYICYRKGMHNIFFFGIQLSVSWHEATLTPVCDYVT